MRNFNIFCTFSRKPRIHCHSRQSSDQAYAKEESRAINKKDLDDDLEDTVDAICAIFAMNLVQSLKREATQSVPPELRHYKHHNAWDYQL